jgi:hypothetical protein
MKEFSQIVRKLLALSVLAKVEHANTAVVSQSYAMHVALGEFYEFLDEFNDKVIEHCIGAGYIPRVEAAVLDISGGTVVTGELLFRELYNASEEIEDETLCNLSADLLQAVTKLKYMMKFK